MPETPSAPPIPYRAELGRKALHLAALAVPAAMLALGPEAARWTLGPLAALAVGADVLRARWAPFRRGVDAVFGGLMRPEERPGVEAPGATPVVLNGATWVVVTAFALALLFPLGVGVPAFAAFMLGDAVAALAGRRFGRHRWPGSARTLEGSAAFAAVSLAILLALPYVAPVPPVPLGRAILVALAMALAEALPLGLNDNVRVPLVGAALLWALS